MIARLSRTRGALTLGRVLLLSQLREQPGRADADIGRALWDVTQEVMDRAGLPAYEISNHARPGAESRHTRI